MIENGNRSEPRIETRKSPTERQSKAKKLPILSRIGNFCLAAARSPAV